MIKHVEIKNKDGKTLRGYLHLGENFDGDLVIMYHGFTGNKTEHACHFRNLSRILENNNKGALRFDFSGNAESDGTFADFTMDTMMDEAKRILDYGRTLDNVKIKRIILLGFSMGGAVAGMIARRYPELIDKLVLWSAAGNINDIIRRYYLKGKKLENGNVSHGCFEISKEMYESLDKYHEYEGLENFKKDTLIIQGKKDLSVDYHYAIKYHELLENSKLCFIENSGHGYDDFCDRDELYSLTLDFIKNEKR